MNRIIRATVGTALSLGLLAGLAPAASAGGPVGGEGNWRPQPHIVRGVAR